ncbi:MAG: hypothetical protein JO097_10485 [Acidobacteriaceae bacterium]|nr:hypothetical protein [Acidobacteriaceae bacterium]MBV9767646.1 hypothetical protein [Acidobacteriaceae bacterium]
MAFLILFAASVFAVSWTPQQSNTTASLRGLQAVSARVAWASGTNGTFLLTTDGGAHWRAAVVPGAESLDFRTVVAFDATTAYLASSGEGSLSRIYKTNDGGAHWQLVFTNPDRTGFFDALAFWNHGRGIVLGDPVNGRFAVFTTGDGGNSWQRQNTPAALRDEGAFAASGTCLTVHGSRSVWFGTGGTGAARVFRSRDGGLSWQISETPIRNDSKSAGIFSLAFRDDLHGEAVGGDYQKPSEAVRNSAITDDGGKNWAGPPRSALKGYRSAVTFIPGLKNTLIAVGTSGSDVSRDGGQSWDSFSSMSFNSVSAAPDGTIWAVGPHGAIGKLTISSH